MISEVVLHQQRGAGSGRRAWLLRNGRPATVEEVALEYYLLERGFWGGIHDSSLLYGSLLWVLFHDILFHDNPASRNPLRAQVYHTPERFYDRHAPEFEHRLAAFAADRIGAFNRAFEQYTRHVLFTHPASTVPKHTGDWVKRHVMDVRMYLLCDDGFGTEDLIREALLSSSKGVNPGWPDLVMWSATELLFVEVKAADEVSDVQRQWLEAHAGGHAVEIVRVVDSHAL